MYKRIKIESVISNLRVVECLIDDASTEIGVSQENYGKILVSILEAVNNAILHGNDSNPDKFVEIEISYENSELIIKVTDEGTGFRPDLVPDSTTPENIELINGRGVYLMSRLADKIEYNELGNVVIMTFKKIIN